ncbi:MAG: alanine--tRNA ligase [Desulfobacterales bacterium]|jgi:alanyl-tRNA synthetase|nr:alanine--tRNA ligase [Desulfobacterales bacterium]
MTGDEIRRKFFEYFKRREHQIVRSSSLVPNDDPTLLFTNAGMVQFKRTFLGEEKRNYTKAATSQKCLRAGGKHNDLENVGYTARHHTFFEMLGNFSFGDYFKESAIEYAWDLLVGHYHLSPDRLWISVYLDDDEAYDIWRKKIGVSEGRIVRLGEKDNFWSMGDTGPCGPCSEILIDRGDSAGCGKPDCRVGCDCDRYLEIWNLVFMQYNRDAAGKMDPLPKPSIDTGMGLERIAAVVQNAPTNYDTDLFMPVISRIESLSGAKLGADSAADVAMKVIADHSRAAAFMVGDGVIPSNEGRGYVLRRILRRAIRYGRNISLMDPFLHETVAAVFGVMKSAYPELIEAKSFIISVIQNEEKRFSETLDNGLKLLNETIEAIKANKSDVIPGDVIFKLYDTYGFPVDIVKDVVRDKGLSLDEDGFSMAMSRQKEQSRSVSSFSAISQAYKELSAKISALPEFVGYDQLSCEARVEGLIADGQYVAEANAGALVDIVTTRTPFYAESGGQVGDAGRIDGEGFESLVFDTVKDPTGLIIHKAKVISGTICAGKNATLTVDLDKRRNTARNHTATHLLHAALRKILGDHVRQSGSYVSPDRLRFDFTHFSQVDTETIDRIEALVNERIRDNINVSTVEMNADEALRSGAMALFEEKYGDRVRVIHLDEFSRELCGGTHTSRTGDIGVFKIIGESSVASGVRRIEALTGDAAIQYLQAGIRILNDSANLVKDRPEGVYKRIEGLIASHKALEKELDRLKIKLASQSAQQANQEIKTINNVKVLARCVEAQTPNVLRDLADQFRDKIQSGIVVLGAKTDAKALLIAVVTQDLLDRYHAGNIIKIIAAEVGGKGGGRPDMAQAGGPDVENLDKAIKKVFEVVSAG